MDIGIKKDKDLLELNRLWEPVFPHLARMIEELYGRREGNVLEIGPFSGLTFELMRRGVGTSFRMAAFPQIVVEAAKKEAQGLKAGSKVTIIESDAHLSGVPDGSCDLAVFRGALFFPSFFQTDLAAVYRKIRNGGTALAGGGFGKHTPPEVIERIKDRSKELNLALGRIHVTEDDVWASLRLAGLQEKAEVLTEGGLWVVLRKNENAGG